MKHPMVYSMVGLIMMVVTASILAHEATGWIAPEEAKKMKNPLKFTRLSVQKGKDIYEKKCALCHGEKGDGKGPVSAGLNPKPTNFIEHHGEKVTDGEHFWKMTTGRGAMPSFEKDLTVEERWHIINYINTFVK